MILITTVVLVDTGDPKHHQASLPSTGFVTQFLDLWQSKILEKYSYGHQEVRMVLRSSVVNGIGNLQSPQMLAAKEIAH